MAVLTVKSVDKSELEAMVAATVTHEPVRYQVISERLFIKGAHVATYNTESQQWRPMPGHGIEEIPPYLR